MYTDIKEMVMDDYNMYKLCENCQHSMEMHIGLVDMGGGHSEVLGCTHVVDYQKGIICECTNSPEE